MPTPRLRDSIDCSFILSIYGKAKITQFAYVIGIMTYVLTILNYDSQLLTLLFFFIFIAFLIAAITIFFSVYVIHEPSLIFKLECIYVLIMTLMGTAGFILSSGFHQVTIVDDGDSFDMKELFSVIVSVSVGCTIIVIETFDPVLFKEFTESYKTKSNSSLVNKVHNFRSAIIGTLFVAITQLVMLLIKYWESTSDQGTLKKISKFFSSISMPSFENLGNLPSSAIGSHRNGQPEENQEIGAIALRNLISVSSGASSSNIQISTEPPDSVINLEEDMTVQSACSSGSFGDESGGAGTSGVVTV